MADVTENRTLSMRNLEEDIIELENVAALSGNQASTGAHDKEENKS